MNDSRLPHILEAKFGEIETGFQVTGFADVQLVKYRSDDRHRISTLGLHRWGWSTQSIRFEWFAEFRNEFSPDRMATAMDYAVQCLLSGNVSPPMQGTYLSLPESVWPEIDSSTLYFTSMPLSERTTAYCKATGLAFVRLFAISQEEKSLIRSNGWQELESRWELADDCQ